MPPPTCPLPPVRCRRRFCYRTGAWLSQVLAQELQVYFPFFGDKCNHRTHLWSSFHYEEAEQRLWVAMLLELLHATAKPSPLPA